MTYKVYFIDGGIPATVKLECTTIQDIMHLFNSNPTHMRLGNHIFAVSQIKHIEYLEDE